MNAGGFVKFTLGKEMMPDNFNGTDRQTGSSRCRTFGAMETVSTRGTS